MENQAADYFKNKEWTRAIDLYNKLLQSQNNTENQTYTYLLDRSECLFELGSFETIVNDCKQILKSFNGKYNSANETRTRIQLIRSLLALNRYREAELVVKEWLMLVKQFNDLIELKMSLENCLERFFLFESNKEKRDIWLNNLARKYAKTSANQNNIENKSQQQQQSTMTNTASVFCIYCNVSFKDKTELISHCLTQEHETMIMSDEGHDWHWRAPPRGFKSDCYTICENWKETGSCRYGVQCVEAHGEPELVEWKERFQYREMKILRAKEKELYGKSYTEDLLEKWAQTTNPSLIMRNKIDDVSDSCSSSLSATVSSKNSHHHWNFKLITRKALRAVALLQDTHRNHFSISRIDQDNVLTEIKNGQEYISCINPLIADNNNVSSVYTVDVSFKTTIYGTFRQTVVFDFGTEPVLVKHLCVDVVPDCEIEKINEIRKEITVSISERWASSNSEIVPFSSSLVHCGNTDWEKTLKSMYPCPQLETFIISNATVIEKKLTRNNYRERMHQLLYIEEIERYNLIAQYNLTTKLQIAHSYLLSPNSMAASTAKYSGNGELFASICLGKELSEDTSEGRLILMHCNSVFLLPNPLQNNCCPVRKVYEALIEDKGKNTIYLRLSAEMVKNLHLTPDTDLEAQIQFQLNRVPYCEWHYTIDKIRNFRLIFPDTFIEPNIPWSPSRQWSSSFDSRLNLKQKEAVVAITTPIAVKIPPILVIGPFGTGKTFTLAQAIKDLIKDDSNKILLCTHSNSAADLYIKDYLDPWVEGGNENARPLRIYYQKRWVATVSPTVQKYCSIRLNGNVREFQVPTFEDIEKYKIVVVTLSTSIYLSAMGLAPGTFTHILLDEAAQALECETITPLALATENTRIVLAGDHMQLGPDIFSQFAKDRNLHISLLERLYDHYPALYPCKILLCENYRAHETIIQFTSESFYDQKLVSSSKQPKHFKYHPLTFFTTLGEDVQDKNSTAFYNNSEVYEVVERVAELKKSWPADWGDISEQSIGVVTPYSDQVFRIRSELRKRKIDVCVERVLNVQGKQFRAIILSTVRTRRTCSNSKTNENVVDYGFLSNSKLLNTAITRAQSLVAVVGDPIALCSLGRCSKVWERFIQICNDNGSLYGITWTELKFQLDGIELKKIYTLNPLAPEFIPRKYKGLHMQEIRAVTAAAAAVPPQQPPSVYPPVISPQVPPPPPPKIVQNVQGFPPAGLRVMPFMYQRPPPPLPLPAPPYVLNLPPPPPPNLALANGYRPMRLHDIPLVVQPPPPPPPQALQGVVHPQNLPPQQQQQSCNNTKLIQFMNNVHFPEAQMLSDCVSLLPQQMSLAEMLLQPPNIQERWYNYLKDTAGPEAADKFKYLLHTTNQKGSRMITEPNLFGRSNTPHSSSESPTFNWYDSPSNQINFNKPIYMKEVEHVVVGNWPPLDFNKSNPLYKRQSVIGQQVQHQQQMNCLYQQQQQPSTSTSSSSSVGLCLMNGGGGVKENNVQRHINDDFANLSVGNAPGGGGGGVGEDWYDVFRAFSTTEQNNENVNSNRTIQNACNVTGGRFYKYFS